ncbi:hypothetical protein CALVIDRAFT_264468 [Calocera viscosa TUFC12733]|uniref:Uncharacterized protein n=1 Tax=Calocera viscosa (strain TUFC12733) TaxID=1330018 RepID=A0A167J4N1_CALVF|nr:hypothetical protein CALVIDRAFT_264468 [Calocera viscosa TUFC12733]
MTALPALPPIPSLPHLLQRALTHLLSFLHSLSSLLHLSSLPALLPYSYSKEDLPDRWLLPPPLTPAPSPTGALTPQSQGRRERQPLTLHVPPSYKSLALAHNLSSPRPILKVRTPSEWSDFEDAVDTDGDRDGEGGEHGEREHARERERERDERVIRFDSVPDIWWIERAERRRSISKSRREPDEPGLWESWFASMALPNTAATRETAFGARMRYDQMVC